MYLMGKRDLTRREFLEKTSTAMAAVGISGVAFSAGQPLLAEIGQKTLPAAAASSDLFDIAPFGRRCVADRNTSQVVFDYAAAKGGLAGERLADGQYIYGLQWAEERDISEVRVLFGPGSAPVGATIEYWFVGWPYPPPRMPSIEDPSDDPWQGKWLKAMTKVERHDAEYCYRFLPLEIDENPVAENLGGLDYRRTLKLRLTFPSAPSLHKVQVFTGSKQKPVQLRIELGAGDAARYQWKGKILAYNGILNDLKLWNGSAGDSADAQHFQVATNGSPKGLALNLVATEPSLEGSYDLTIVTLDAGERTFSFAVCDVEKGPVYVPDFHAYVTLASDKVLFAPSIVKKGEKIRDKLAKEPEQTYERAMKEIPELDPAERQWPSRLNLPLGSDSSWQKFAFEWGGNITIGKRWTKAKGAELRRLEWPEDQIHWRIGTGETPSFRPGWRDSKLHILEDHLPVVTAKWSTDSIQYVEEGFATPLSGPLSPEDPGRSEQTPTILMLKLTCHNAGTTTATSHLWLATDPVEEVVFEQSELVSANRPLVRAHVRLPISAQAKVAQVPYDSSSLQGIHVEFPLDPGEVKAVLISLPFIPGLSQEERGRLAALDYDAERARIVSYWREVVALPIPFDVPEPQLMSLAKANLVHIRISVTKDPKSGLYMLPPASYLYDAYAEEIGIQAVGFDALGDSRRAALYLESMIQLQGSSPFAGTFTGDQAGVYHGARVDAEYDYTAEGDYNVDHGLLLWGLAEHYFFTRDKEWLHHAAPSMKRAADWVFEQRKLTQVLDGGEKAPEYGLLPAGRLEDSTDWANWFSVNVFALGGMIRLAQALADAGAPEAAHYAQETEAYRQDLRQAVLRASRSAPVTRLRDNSYIPWVPSKPHQRFRLWGPVRVGLYSRYPERVLPCFRSSATREVLYAPIQLLVFGAFRNDEPLANWVLDDWEDNLTMSTSLGLNVHGWVDDEYWFSRGGMVFEANLHNPILPYLYRNEIPAAIRNFYNDFVACRYRDVNAFTEEYRQWVHASGPFYKASEEMRSVYWLRNMLLLEDGDTLLLAPGIPRAWLAPGKRIELRDAPSYFGPVSYKLEPGNQGVEAGITLPSRNPYKTAWFVVRAPDGKKINSVTIDGKPWTEFDASAERIRLPVRTEPMTISVRF
jgi:hypothetical protein